jgi:hypothetical protein
MSNLKVFAQSMRQRGKDIEERSGKLLGDTLIGIAEGLIPHTPIKEGRARRNWQANKSAPLTTYLDAPAIPGDGEREAITNARFVASKLKSGDVAHLTNNAPYIGELNRGSSTQAPAMFVQMEVLKALERIREFKLVIK